MLLIVLLVPDAPQLYPHCATMHKTFSDFVTKPSLDLTLRKSLLS